MNREVVARELVDCAFEVHSTLGPGLLESAYEAQLLSYLKLGHYHLGFLLNLNLGRMKQGIRRMLNGYQP